MTFVQDETFTRRRMPSQRMVGGALGRTFDISSDMPPGQYISANTEIGKAVIPGFTAWHEYIHATLVNMPAISTTVTVGTAEPIIHGTGIPLYRVTALLDGGMTIPQVMEDFPSLTAEQIATARDYARHHPNFGKAYPTKSLKRMLRKSGFHRLKKELVEIRGARSVSSR